MNNPKHTPGPWRLNEFHINREGLTVCELVTSDNSKRIARIDGHVLDSCKASNEANADARLIAAAPEMIETLKLALSSLQLLLADKLPNVTDDDIRLIKAIELVIAKATGGSNE